MRTGNFKIVWAAGLLGSIVALAGEALAGEGPAGEAQVALPQSVSPHAASPHEPAGFIAGGVIGGLAAGPVGAVVGAGIGTWLGNRVHRAGDAARLESQVGGLQAEQVKLKAQNAALNDEKGDLAETNRALTARLDQLSLQVDTAQFIQEDAARSDAARALDGLQGDVLFRTGSADIAPEAAHGLQVLAAAVAKSPDLNVRVDGYADPRGSIDTNLKLSEARAAAVRDLFLAAGVGFGALEINAYGKSQSTAADADGYALERRVRLTLQAQGAASAVAQAGEQGVAAGGGDASGVGTGGVAAGGGDASGVGMGGAAAGGVEESGGVTGGSAAGGVEESGVGTGGAAAGRVDESGIAASRIGPGGVGGATAALQAGDGEK
jgi:outer membrane protein OmpA-like peptidoglycan-associated protein